MVWKVRVTGRGTEWHLAIITALFGVFLLNGAESMDSPAFAALNSIMPEDYWGVFFFATGSLHAFSLAINGRAWWTPFTRMACAGLNGVIYLVFAVGIGVSDPFTTGVFTYLGYPFLISMMVLWRAADDAGAQIGRWRRAKLYR